MIILTREQLEDRLAALHRASVELVRDLSLETVLERIINLAREQVGARYAALGVVDENEELKKFITVGMTDDEIARIAHPPVGLGLIAAIQDERRTIRVAEISEDFRSIGFPPYHPMMYSFLGVPVLSGNRLLGQIYLTDKQNGSEFTEADERVIESLAAYAAVAITNARLYEGVLERDLKLEQRNQDLSLLDSLAKTLASSLEIDEILDETLVQVMGYLNVEAGEIFLTEEGGPGLRLALHRGEAANAFWTRERFLVGEGLVGSVAKSEKPKIATISEPEPEFLRKAVKGAGFHCLASIPLTARRKVVGVMTVVSRYTDQFDERALDLLTAIGTWAGTAIENARLHRQARRLAVLEERERIGMDLHDGVIQSIYAVGLALEYARGAIGEHPNLAHEKIVQAIDGLNNTIKDIRAYILDLRPHQLRSEESIMEGFGRLVDEFRKHTNAEASIIAPNDGLKNLPREHALTLLHICQEALANTAKHALAQKADVRLWAVNERVLLEVTDNGKGFDLRKMSVTLGHGLSNMLRRARKVGGDVEIYSSPMEGTSVLAWVPRQTAESSLEE